MSNTTAPGHCAAPGAPGCVLGALQAAPSDTAAVPVTKDKPTWLAFHLDTDHDEARAVFVRRFGCHPAEVRPGLGGLLFVGPIPGQQTQP
jgi:hypothetical protein